MNRRKVNSVLAGIGIALLGAGAIPGIVHAEEPPPAEVTTGAPAASGEDSATTWDKTKEVSGETWEATKEGSAKAWDKTKEVSGDAWEATKEGSASAWDKTRDMTQDEQQSQPESDTDAHQEAPVTPDQSP